MVMLRVPGGRVNVGLRVCVRLVSRASGLANNVQRCARFAKKYHVTWTMLSATRHACPGELIFSMKQVE